MATVDIGSPFEIKSKPHRIEARSVLAKVEPTDQDVTATVEAVDQDVTTVAQTPDPDVVATVETAGRDWRRIAGLIAVVVVAALIALAVHKKPAGQ